MIENYCIKCGKKTEHRMLNNGTFECIECHPKDKDIIIALLPLVLISLSILSVFFLIKYDNTPVPTLSIVTSFGNISNVTENQDMDDIEYYMDCSEATPVVFNGDNSQVGVTAESMCVVKLRTKI